MKEPITKIESKAISLLQDNIDTDQIIPARFLKATDKAGFGRNLFRDLRYSANGEKITHPLNAMKKDIKILLTGTNFGCGSSREHAAWAIYDFGFRVVVGENPADIFKNNALNNGIVVIDLPKKIIERCAASGDDTTFAIDLTEQTITNKKLDEIFSFSINPFKKECLLKGFDEIDYLINLKPEIEHFEQNEEIGSIY